MKRLYQKFENGFSLAMTLVVAMSFAGTVKAQDVGAAQPDRTDAGKVAVPYAPPTPRGNISSDAVTPKILESWTTPSLAGSHLEAGDEIAGEVDTVDGVYTHEVTRVQWRPADPIDLYIIMPVGVKNPPVILYLYSYPFETDRFLNHDFCKFLVKDGYAAVGFASALTGQRYHSPRPMKEWFVSQMEESLATSAHDVQMILNYLDTRGDVDMNKVGMFGDGSGASIAILAAAVDARIKTLDLLNPWGDWPDWIAKSTRIPEKERPDYLKAEWLAEVAPLDPLKWLPQLKTQKLRIQFVKSVTVTPVKAQQKLEAAAPANAQIVHYADANALRVAVASGTGFDWLKKSMQAGGSHRYRASEQKSVRKALANRSKDSQN